MTYAYVMRTVDRQQRPAPATNYLGATLRRLYESVGTAAFESIRILDSTPTGADVPWWAPQITGLPHPFIVPADRVYNSLENAVRALNVGIDLHTDWIIHLEDDLDVIADLFGSIDRWLRQHANDHYVLYTFHTPYRDCLERFRQGIETWQYPVNKFYGNQCWAIRRHDAINLCQFLLERMPTWTTGQGFDLLIKEWAVKSGEGHFLASCPSFVQHMGKESSLHLGRFHENSSWPGQEWSYQP